jgi:hypothetical protein
METTWSAGNGFGVLRTEAHVVINLSKVVLSDQATAIQEGIILP